MVPTLTFSLRPVTLPHLSSLTSSQNIYHISLPFHAPLCLFELSLSTPKKEPNSVLVSLISAFFPISPFLPPPLPSIHPHRLRRKRTQHKMGRSWTGPFLPAGKK